MSELEKVVEILQKRSPVVAMLAPSFPIMYRYPEIVGKLKRMGFDKVMEVAVGARDTNKAVIDGLKNNKRARFITGPCPSIVRMIRTKFPEALPFLATSVDSPMVATAKSAKLKYPDYQLVFIGPCNTKRLEAAEDHPEMGMICITYRELNNIIEKLKVNDDLEDSHARFDDEETETRLYPISGGLAQSSEVSEILNDTEVEVVSGWKNDEEAIKRFLATPQIRLLDVLFCDGGCISGPGIDSTLTLTERRKKITDHWQKIQMDW